MTETKPTAFTPEQYASLYPPGIERHYWNHARNRIIARKLVPLVRPGDRVLDIGCGPGIVVDYLRGVGIDCHGVDIGMPSPVGEAVAPFLRLGISASDLSNEFRQAISVLLLIDILEHLPEPAKFLMDCEARFPQAKHVFVTVPARMEIWSNYDEYNGHYRRCTLESVADFCEGTSFHLSDSGYFFHALYPVARVMRLAKMRRSTRISTPTFAFVHAVIARLFDAEEATLAARVPGSSLHALLERD
jgi:hypothetical protein